MHQSCNLLTAHAIEQAGLKLVAVVINQLSVSDDSDMDNLADLEDWLDRSVIPLPRYDDTEMIWKNIAEHSTELDQFVSSFSGQI